jgi:hypothetical protein
MIGLIPELDSEPAVREGRVVFEYFVDDNHRAAKTFGDMILFLYKQYFPHLV